MPFKVEHQVELPTETPLRAVLAELEVREIPKREGGTFEKLKWHFEITQQGDYLGKKVAGESSAYLSDSPDNVFRNWAEALLGRPLDLGQELYPSDLVGLQAEIQVSKEQDRKDATKFWRRVSSVKAIQGGFGDEPPF